jgi:hypothetical protein
VEHSALLHALQCGPLEFYSIADLRHQPLLSADLGAAIILQFQITLQFQTVLGLYPKRTNSMVFFTDKLGRTVVRPPLVALLVWFTYKSKTMTPAS